MNGARLDLCVGGDKILASGDKRRGDCITAVQDQLTSVQKIHATDLAFDAVLADGSAVTWGSPGDMYDPQGVWDILRHL